MSCSEIRIGRSREAAPYPDFQKNTRGNLWKMRCSKCGSDNREGRKFCGSCGAPLSVPCPKCGASNQPGEKFCGDCGAGLTEDSAAKPREVKAGASAGGERRHLTILFCDLVGSTEIAARLDPEEWREVIASYHRGATDAITRFGGYVAQYSGDGVMAYFGWPNAHENDAERAARRLSHSRKRH